MFNKFDGKYMSIYDSFPRWSVWCRWYFRDNIQSNHLHSSSNLVRFFFIIALLIINFEFPVLITLDLITFTHVLYHTHTHTHTDCEFDGECFCVLTCLHVTPCVDTPDLTVVWNIMHSTFSICRYLIFIVS